ncbi:hypothetical protein LPJ73_004440 [Coemansia sp. RSA 2703]|nr:hypothetical protein LPJ73_004440 [Coemansia sp. RSA 2703]KAJ2375465.1 hypothetical protein IW150_002538 [Coemansia sp. RSA 2607]KAJ2396393.1 hypothetical protein GGI05_001146 [Coemansia sp. RSA 2603]
MVELVAVIGASGAQGKSIVKVLSEHPDKYKIRGITRNTGSTRVQELQKLYPNVEWVSAKLDDIDSLHQAFQGVDIVFGNTSYLEADILERADAGDFDAQFRQGKNMVDAAVAQNVKHIVYSTVVSAAEISKGKYTNAYDTEGKAKIKRYIEESPIDGYFVYAGFYFQNYLRPYGKIGDKVLFKYPLPPDSKQLHVDIEEDLGNTVELILSDRDKYKGKSIAAGEGYYSGNDVAAAYTRATGIDAVFQFSYVPGYDRPDVNSMFDFYAEFDGFSGVDTNEAKQHAHKPFTTLDQFWAKHRDFKP